MSSLPAVQCLFCNHLNPAGASFCNNCGSQMHMQPCDRCGALCKRSAKNCHKCGAGFTLPAAPTTEADSATAFSARPDPAHSSPEPSGPDETGTSEIDATTTGLRHTWHAPLLVILLAAVTVSGYFFFERSESTGPNAKRQGSQGAVPSSQGRSGAAVSAALTASSIAAPLEAAMAPTEMSAKPATGAAGLDSASSSATDAEARIRQDPPAFKECPPALAALAICNPSAKHKEQ